MLRSGVIPRVLWEFHVSNFGIQTKKFVAGTKVLNVRNTHLPHVVVVTMFMGYAKNRN